MPIDVAWVRGLLENTAIVWVDGGGGTVDAEEDVLAMVTEIEQLRAQVVELEEQLRVLAEGSEEDDLVILPTPISFEVIERYTKAMKSHEPYSGKYTVGQRIRIRRTGQTGVITERGYLSELTASGAVITYNNIQFDGGGETDADEYEIEAVTDA